jgi:hypothetical protein
MCRKMGDIFDSHRTDNDRATKLSSISKNANNHAGNTFKTEETLSKQSYRVEKTNHEIHQREEEEQHA